MDKSFKASFTRCPCCGSTERFFESINQEQIDSGKSGKDCHAYYNVSQGVVIDQNRAALIPIGGAVPGFVVATDICTRCGCIYAVQLLRTEAKLEAKPRQYPPTTQQFRVN